MANFLRRPLRYRFYNVTIILVVVNVLAFLYTYYLARGRGVANLALFPSDVLQNGAWWQVVTYMFLHGSWSHIFWNMLGLFMFGIQLERRTGSSEFLLFYFVCGIGAGIATVLFNTATGQGMIPVIGASGAVYAVELAFATFFPDARIFLFGLIPIRAPILVAGIVVIEIVSQLLSLQSGVAHLTHLAGLAFAYLYLLVRFDMNPVSIFLHRR
jgi:membrane associated rhomboid family serine protease